jgi:hypothetical protein
MQDQCIASKLPCLDTNEPPDFLFAGSGIVDRLQYANIHEGVIVRRNTVQFDGFRSARGGWVRWGIHWRVGDANCTRCDQAGQK